MVLLPWQEDPEFEESRNGDAGTSSSHEHGRRDVGSSDNGETGASRSGTGSNDIRGGVELGPIALSFNEDQRDDRYTPRLRMQDRPSHSERMQAALPPAQHRRTDWTSCWGVSRLQEYA